MGHPYPYWADLGLDSIISNTQEDPLDPTAQWDAEVYCDNHGIAAVEIAALPQGGSVTIEATAEFPYTPLRGKFPPLTSEEITANWGALELDSYFEAWPRTSDEAPLEVTFTNLSMGGVPPYTAALWDWGDGTAPLAISIGDPDTNGLNNGDQVTHVYTKEGIFSPSLTITDSSSPILRSDEQKLADYIIVGEGVVVPDDPAVEDGLASIEDYLVLAYGYQSGEGTGGWTVYNPDWPAQQNDLETLYIGRGYWINVSQACTLEYGTHTYQLSAGWNLIGWLGK
jgi:hypothetical protein